MEIHLNDTQVVDLIRSEVPWNVARRAFSNASARISANALTLMELRRAELLAVADIARAFGIILALPGASPEQAAPEGPGARPGSEVPAGPCRAPLDPENVA